jgi:putative tryptophan/tyrosine transport system substrate-binding protein
MIAGVGFPGMPLAIIAPTGLPQGASLATHWWGPEGHMRRRAFIAGLGWVTTWPMLARGQDRIRKIGIFLNFTPGEPVGEARLSSFLRALESLGWAEGRNIHIETRWAEGDPERMRKDVAELVALSPDVILVATTPAVTLFNRASKSVPSYSSVSSIR